MTGRTQAERLATIETLLKNMADRQEEDRADQRQNQAHADEGRAIISQKITKLARDQEAIMEWRTNKVDPFVDLGTSMKSKATGALLALGIVGGIIWAGIKFFKDQLMTIFGS